MCIHLFRCADGNGSTETHKLLSSDRQRRDWQRRSNRHAVQILENTVAELLGGMGCYSDLALRRTLGNSFMLSSDVSAGYDPAYGECFEKKNAAYLGRGIVLNKFTGARGKSGSNDANAEYVARYARFLTTAMLHSRQQNLVKLMSVAVERSPISLHFTV